VGQVLFSDTLIRKQVCFTYGDKSFFFPVFPTPLFKFWWNSISETAGHFNLVILTNNKKPPSRKATNGSAHISNKPLYRFRNNAIFYTIMLLKCEIYSFYLKTLKFHSYMAVGNFVNYIKRATFILASIFIMFPGTKYSIKLLSIRIINLPLLFFFLKMYICNIYIYIYIYPNHLKTEFYIIKNKRNELKEPYLK
jgi:hypothetical protein